MQTTAGGPVVAGGATGARPPRLMRSVRQTRMNKPRGQPVTVNDRSLAVGAALLSVFMTFPRAALACICVENGPPCQEFWKAPVVFAGRVESVTKIPGERYGSIARARFRVIEPFRGTNATEIDLFSYSNNCSIGFRRGQEWIIYAFPRPDGPGLMTGICTRSQLMSKATEDLSYALAVYSSHPEKGRIFGSLTYSINENGSRRDEPIANVQITVRGPSGDSSVVKTDANGRYEILARPGLSRLTPALPPGMSFGTAGIELLDARGCTVADLAARYAGRIVGRVLSASGAPVPHLAVELVHAKGRDSPFSQRRTLTDTAGRFEMSDIEPGSYIPAVAVDYVNPSPSAPDIETRYIFAGGTTTKGESKAIWVDGAHTGRADVVLPKAIRVVQVAGIVVHADGRPAKGIEVRTKADFDYFDLAWTTIRTDGHGRFKLALVAGNRYRMVAETARTGARDRLAARITVEPSVGMAPLRMVIR